MHLTDYEYSIYISSTVDKSLLKKVCIRDSKQQTNYKSHQWNREDEDGNGPKEVEVVPQILLLDQAFEHPNDD